MGGTAIYDFTRTKSKMYSIHNVNNYEKSVHKGHNLLIKNEEFKDVHSNKKVIRHKMRGFKSLNHKIYTYTYESNKTSLSCYDDIFFLME